MKVPRNIVGAQVMLLRNRQGWSQGKLATVFQIQGWDISRGVVARIEGGERWVADFELLDLARALGVPVQELYPAAKRDAFLASKSKREFDR